MFSFTIFWFLHYIVHSNSTKPSTLRNEFWPVPYSVRVHIIKKKKKMKWSPLFKRTCSVPALPPPPSPARQQQCAGYNPLFGDGWLL